MISMETFLIGATGGAFAAFAINKANQMTAMWKSTEAALLSHDAAIGALVQNANISLCNCEASAKTDAHQSGGQYL